LRHFHTFEDVFLLGRAGKMPKAKSNALRPKRMKKQMVDEKTNAETQMLTEQRLKMNPWWDYFRHKIDVSMRLDANFNFQNIHLILYWAEKIRGYKALQLYSAERHSQSHKMNPNDSWNTSNHNLNYLP
jgi:hypothetical protein